MKKYEFTEERQRNLNRIRYLIDIPSRSIKAGDLGGFIETESNLSHEGTCCIFIGSYVYGNASVSGTAFISGNVNVYDNAHVSGTAFISGNAHVYGNARVYDNAHVYDNARVFDNAHVSGNARVFDNARIYGNSRVSGYARVLDNARIYGNSRVSCNAHVSGNSEIYEKMDIKYGLVQTKFTSLKDNILAQTNLLCEDDYVIAYKRVRSNLSSEYDPNFIYKVGEWAEVTEYDTSNASCAKGLHVSTPTYYPKSNETQTILKCKVMLEDIITVQEGKIRCKRLFVEKIIL